MLEHAPFEQTPLSAQSLFVEQTLVKIVVVGAGVVSVFVVKVCEAAVAGKGVVKISVVNVRKAVAVRVGVAVSTSREKARLGAVDIMIKECRAKNV
jgi:nitrogen regulatory protein PII